MTDYEKVELTNSNPTQCKDVLRFLANHGKITKYQGLNIGILGLSSRMAELKKSGIKFTKTMIPFKKANGEITRIAEYSVDKVEQNYIKIKLEHDDTIAKIIRLKETAKNAEPNRKRMLFREIRQLYDKVSIQKRMLNQFDKN